MAGGDVGNFGGLMLLPKLPLGDVSLLTRRLA